MPAATAATAIAVSATRTASSGVSTTPEAKPHEPWWMTRTAKPRSSLSLAPCRTPVTHEHALVAHPLEAEVGVGSAELTGAAQGRVAERAVGRSSVKVGSRPLMPANLVDAQDH